MYTPLFFLGIYFSIAVICLSVFIYTEIKTCKMYGGVYTLSIKDILGQLFIASLWPIALTIFIGIKLDDIGENLSQHLDKTIIKIDYTNKVNKEIL